MNNENKKPQAEEIDIVVLLNKIKDFFLSVVLLLFREIKNLISGWRALSAIIIAGAILGAIAENIFQEKSSKEASVLLRINFDAGNYVYDAINLINQKIESEDEEFFLNDIRLGEEETLYEIEIEPVVDLKDILKEEINASEIRALFENLEFDDNVAMTQGFRSDYEYHILDLEISSLATTNSVNKIIEYFNTNPLFVGLKESKLKSITSTIANNEFTIKQIDKLLEYYSSNTRLEKSSSQLYIDNKTYLPNELIKIKIDLEEQNEELKGERILSEETVMIVNDTNLFIENQGISDNKIIYYPALLVLLFITGSILIRTYSYLDELEGKM